MTNVISQMKINSVQVILLTGHIYNTICYREAKSTKQRLMWGRMLELVVVDEACRRR